MHLTVLCTRILNATSKESNHGHKHFWLWHHRRSQSATFTSSYIEE